MPRAPRPLGPRAPEGATRPDYVIAHQASALSTSAKDGSVKDSDSVSFVPYTDADGFIPKLVSSLPAGAPSITEEDQWTDDQILRWSCGGVLSHMRDYKELGTINTGNKDDLRNMMLTCSHEKKDDCDSDAKEIADKKKLAKLGAKDTRAKLFELLSSASHAQLTKTWILGREPLCTKHSPSDDELLRDISQNGAVWPSNAALRGQKFSECGLSIRPDSVLSSFHPSFTRHVEGQWKRRCGLMLPINRADCPPWPRPAQSDEFGSIPSCSFPHILFGLRRTHQKPEYIIDYAQRSQLKKAQSPKSRSRPTTSQDLSLLTKEIGTVENTKTERTPLTGTGNDSPEWTGFPSEKSHKNYQHFLRGLDGEWYKPYMEVLQLPEEALDSQGDNLSPTMKSTVEDPQADQTALLDAKREWMRSDQARKLIIRTHKLGTYLPEGEDEKSLMEIYRDAARTEEVCSYTDACESRILIIEALKGNWPWRRTDDQGTETKAYCHWGCQILHTLSEVFDRRFQNAVREELKETLVQPDFTSVFSTPDSQVSRMSGPASSYVNSGKRRKTEESFRAGTFQATVPGVSASTHPRAEGNSTGSGTQLCPIVISSGEEELSDYDEEDKQNDR